MDGVFANQHGGPRHSTQSRDPRRMEKFPSQTIKCPSFSLTDADLFRLCFEGSLSDSLRTQCGWIYNHKKWDTLHKHLLIRSKYYF